MTHASRTWAFPALVTIASLGLVLPVIAQQAREHSKVNDAKAMVALIQQGQLDLAKATQLAEQHVKGKALNVNCGIEQHSPKRVVYTITCFAQDDLKLVRVDGMTKEVTEEKERPEGH